MATIKSYTLKDGTEKWEFFVSKGRSKATGMPISIHKRGFANKTAAVNAAAIVQGQLKSGEYLEKNPEKLRLGDFMDYWIENYKNKVSEGTRIVHRDNIRMYINPYIANYKLEEYTRAEHQKHINMLATKKEREDDLKFALESYRNGD
ncbi:N-terminal phage integrase SAM-like domain-containing protein [Streptomyces sp. P17]|uniref:N-terminal phage integrase SAM-like domain-containing protein n=3 Tax=unclassified Streptomyces TaxID=2593676 RepID=UPI00259E9F86|nr:N-terminal phage integrase SAM-like domain-containing protein [Streptomyces sp. P17]MDM7320479.1 N-terminal phage integrase SAM-like domain-containing protein [Fervidobacterium sp.]MDT9700912.1 N-terminal phage integrase SAM-like domain-containing protein [Streptomyces sp. P17]